MKNKFLYIVLGVFLLLTSCKTAKISSADLKNATLVDVRTPEQFAKSPVKNAVNIPLKDIENNLDFFRKQKQSVLFCNSGRQAGEAYEILQKHGITNIQNAKTWENVYIMENNFLDQLVFSKEKPSTFVIKKNDKIQQFAVGLGEETLLKKHVTTVPANLVMVKGEIVFKINGKELTMKTGDTFEIPVNIEHEVIGKDQENVFIITKILD